MDEVEPMYFTEPIPNDTISVRSDMSEEWDKKSKMPLSRSEKMKKENKSSLIFTLMKDTLFHKTAISTS